MAQENPQYQDLMRQAIAGDKGAYETLLKVSAALLRPFLAKHLRGTNEADDVLQEILISLHRAKHTYDGQRPYKPWLFAIARYRLHDYWRRRYGNIFNRTLDISELADILPAPVTEQDSRYEDVQKELHQLPGKQAQIVELMHGEGYTAKEVGVQLGMNESAVKVAAHRAYKKLRERLGKND